MLIGLDYSDLHQSLHEVKGGEGEPIARLTPLGWTCVGKLHKESNSSNSYHCTFFQKGDSVLNDTLIRFREIESVETGENQMSADNLKVIQSTEQAIKYNGNRYEVSLPWKVQTTELPDNFDMAYQRLENTEKRLKKNVNIYETYRNTIERYVDLGYVSKVEKNDGKRWYLLHFPVLRPEKATTKVRIVFDASARCNGLSLNDVVSPGPKFQRDLFDVLLRFRQKPIAIMCDIQEMYLQVGITLSDRPFHSFLWRSSFENEPEVYQFNRLVFGVNASPFLAQYVSQYNAQCFTNEFPLAAETVIKSTYMDDSMDSVSNEEEGIELYRELSGLWHKASMYARKWFIKFSNCS
ncbi:uncharacterized protein LOC128557265 [Mercenaria mercenaria]|uniref:uncharacterized protein LOC128557265 n=1 Tax=Mercenaria mercenaria TaxID=6596 RepID=UPI00234E5D90|nr:uncharacterized protein LOC128557265 [Mercenaria mercenaria]